jgi:TfoX/Sxy family transcriptional regulator of competence genes
MAYDELLTERIRRAFHEQNAIVEEKKMMGGICFLVDGKMCAGVVRNKMMARIDPDFQDQALKVKGCTEMDFTHRPMKGFVFVEPEGTDLETDLEYWVKLTLEFNPRAKASKKK